MRIRVKFIDPGRHVCLHYLAKWDIHYSPKFYTFISFIKHRQYLILASDRMNKFSFPLISNFRRIPEVLFFCFGWYSEVWILCADVSGQSVCSIFIGGGIPTYKAYEDGIDRVFRNVGTSNSGSGESPKRRIYQSVLCLLRAEQICCAVFQERKVSSDQIHKAGTQVRCSRHTYTLQTAHTAS